MEGQSGIVEPVDRAQEDENRAEENDAKCSDERPERLPFLLFDIWVFKQR